MDRPVASSDAAIPGKGDDIDNILGFLDEEEKEDIDFKPVPDFASKSLDPKPAHAVDAEDLSTSVREEDLLESALPDELPKPQLKDSTTPEDSMRSFSSIDTDTTRSSDGSDGEPSTLRDNLERLKLGQRRREEKQKSKTTRGPTSPKKQYDLSNDDDIEKAMDQFFADHSNADGDDDISDDAWSTSMSSTVDAVVTRFAVDKISKKADPLGKGSTHSVISFDYVPSDDDLSSEDSDGDDDDSDDENECPICLGILRMDQTWQVNLVRNLLCRKCLDHKIELERAEKKLPPRHKAPRTPRTPRTDAKQISDSKQQNIVADPKLTISLDPSESEATVQSTRSPMTSPKAASSDNVDGRVQPSSPKSPVDHPTEATPNPLRQTQRQRPKRNSVKMNELKGFAARANENQSSSMNRNNGSINAENLRGFASPTRTRVRRRTRSKNRPTATANSASSTSQTESEASPEKKNTASRPTVRRTKSRSEAERKWRERTSGRKRRSKTDDMLLSSYHTSATAPESTGPMSPKRTVARDDKDESDARQASVEDSSLKMMDDEDDGLLQDEDDFFRRSLSRTETM